MGGTGADDATGGTTAGGGTAGSGGTCGVCGEACKSNLGDACEGSCDCCCNPDDSSMCRDLDSARLTCKDGICHRATCGESRPAFEGEPDICVDVSDCCRPWASLCAPLDAGTE